MCDLPLRPKRFMPSEPPASQRWLNDIRYQILEIISEASRRLPDEIKARHPSIAWKEMAGAGSVYRHDYEDVAASHVWVTVHDHLPPLRAVIEHELAAFK